MSAPGRARSCSVAAVVLFTVACGGSSSSTSPSPTDPPVATNTITITSSGGGAYTIPSGSHTISVLVDDVDRIAESNKNNNALSDTITVP